VHAAVRPFGMSWRNEEWKNDSPHRSNIVNKHCRRNGGKCCGEDGSPVRLTSCGGIFAQRESSGSSSSSVLRSHKWVGSILLAVVCGGGGGGCCHRALTVLSPSTKAG